ncbi:sigma-70 family RNA polymerase sigma factor [Amycolatopsis sp. NPDC004079]|uniref:RNA polymerase sigma factor n=1 Tax=Amycolatopsis sp. NPDC004079 TaxID=3154549 RepID=UPI0033BD0D00
MDSAGDVDSVGVAVGSAPPPGSATFAEYYDEDAQRLVRFLMGLGAGVHDAADIAHTVLTELFRNWDLVRSPRQWTRSNAVWALYKKPPSHEHEILAEVVPDSASAAFFPPEHYAQVAESAAQVRALLAPLPEQQRLVMACLMDGLTHREIAQTIRTTPAAVAKAAARARATLKDRIREDRQSQEER